MIFLCFTLKLACKIQCTPYLFLCFQCFISLDFTSMARILSVCRMFSFTPVLLSKQHRNVCRKKRNYTYLCGGLCLEMSLQCLSFFNYSTDWMGFLFVPPTTHRDFSWWLVHLIVTFESSGRTAAFGKSSAYSHTLMCWIPKHLGQCFKTWAKKKESIVLILFAGMPFSFLHCSGMVNLNTN